MDDLTPLEVQLTAVLDRMGGPTPRVDAMAIVTSARTKVHTRRIRLMFDATRFVAATGVVALSGWLLVASINAPLHGIAPAPGAAASAIDPCATAVVPVSGTILWGTQEQGTNVTDAAGTHYRGWVYHSSLAIDDDRLDGDTTATLDWDFSDGAGVHRGVFRVDNEAGSWGGPYNGVGPSTSDWRAMAELTGAGAYEGLTASLFMDSDQVVEGSIYPTGLPTCAISAGG